MSAARVLVTGGAGFLGVHLSRELRAFGDEVRILDLADPPPWIDALAVDYRRGDLRDRAAVSDALGGADALVHAAFASPYRTAADLREVNVQGTRLVFERAAALGVPRAVLISSTIVRQPPRAHPLLARAPLSRLDAYRASRVAAEDLVREPGWKHLSLAVVRPKTFIGPERVGAFAILFERIRRGLTVPVLGTGQNRYQLLDVRDMADGLRRLIHAEAQGAFEFGAAEYSTVADDLQALIDHAATGARLRFISPAWSRLLLRAMELAALPPLSEWHRASARGEDSIVDTSRAERELGWRAQRSNPQALCEAFDWYRDRMTASGSAPTTHPVPRVHRALERLVRLLG